MTNDRNTLDELDDDDEATLDRIEEQKLEQCDPGEPDYEVPVIDAEGQGQRGEDLCIDCMQDRARQRLGRSLIPADFTGGG